MFLPNILRLNLRKIKKTKTVLYGFIEIVNDLNVNQLNNELIKGNISTIVLCKNGYTIMIL